MSRVYLDHNATAPLRAEARAAMIAAMDVVGNPSSVHAEGRAARGLVERARAQVAAAVGAAPDEIIFTAGATEAAGVLAQMGPDVAVHVAPTAHDALWAHDGAGGGATAAVHVHAMGLANSETGIVTPPPPRDDAGRWVCGAVRADRLLLDVTQAVGRIPFAFGWSGVDMAVLSGHKLGAPKGVGALVLRGGVEVPALVRGGGQEMGRRAGTENVIGIAALGAAAEAAQAELAAGRWAAVAELRNILEEAIAARSAQTIFVGKDRDRLPNTACLIAPGWKGETQVMAMDLAGFAISAGSACSSGKVRSSRVLRALGYDDAAAGSAVRVSLGLGTTKDEVLRFAEAWTSAYAKRRDRAA